MLSTIIIILIALVFIWLLRKSKVGNHLHWPQFNSSLENKAYYISELDYA